MNASALHSPVVDAALTAAADLLGMELVIIGGLDEQRFTFERVVGAFAGISEGMVAERADAMCHRMLAGAPNWTATAATDVHYADSPIRVRLEIGSYVGVPIRGHDGAVLGTLCGLDHGSVPVSESAVALLHDLAGIVARHLETSSSDGVIIRRTPAGWLVGADEPEDDLITAMALADLLAGAPAPARRPTRVEDPGDEADALRVAVQQLEHALTARITIEQAIGVLAERQSTAPRAAFELLRKVARRRGEKVRDLAAQVVLSACEPSTTLPPELGER
jgi:hypothetical protein